MSHHHALTNRVIDLLPDLNFSILLDCGCGYGTWTLITKFRRPGLYHSIGIDVFKKYLKIQKEINIYDSLILSDIRKLPIRKKSVDVLIAGDIIEHVTRKDGLNLIKILKEIPKKMIIFTTPEKFMKTIGYDDNKYQIHRSGYSQKDFDGYKIKYVTPFKFPKPVRILIKITKIIRRHWWHNRLIIAYMNLGD